MRVRIKKYLSIFIVGIMLLSINPAFEVNAVDSIAGNGRLLVGYWHNFDNGSCVVKLRDVDPAWDVINVSFGETYTDRAIVELHPIYDEKEFIDDIAYLQSKGKKVVLSLGGAEGTIHVHTDEAREKFMTSLTGLIDKFGFDGIDIDLEGGSGMILEPGDTDLKNPTTPQIVNFIKIIKDLVAIYGDEFIISMAPELSYVQGGNTGYSNNWGAYLPLIDAVRDELDYLQVQHYNCGGNMALDGAFYNQGTADFQVAMVDMLLQGFETRASKNSFFEPLRQDQVVIGVPASQQGTLMPNSGYIPPEEMLKALNYLVHGKSYGGSYKMVGEKYPNLRGIMTWSINWDMVNNNEFINSYRPFFDSLPPIKDQGPSLRAAMLKASEVKEQSYTLTIEIPSSNTAISYDLIENGNIIESGMLKSQATNSQIITKKFTNKEFGEYTYNVVVKDSTGQSAKSTNCVVKVNDPNGNSNREDINSDGVVDIADLSKLASLYNNKITDVKYDLNNDGIVDLYDIVRVAKKIESIIDVPSSKEWKEGVAYKVGDQATYQGKTYECIYAHTSNSGWIPTEAFTLWKLI